MAWQPIQFKKPAELSAVLTSGQSLLNGKLAALDAVSSELAAAPSLGGGGAGLSSPLIANAAVFDDALQRLTSVVIHPWCEGIGEGVGHNRYLAPANAVSAMANKFLDTNDAQRPAQTMDALFLLVTGNSNAQMHTNLMQLNSVVGHPDLRMCASRFDALANLEREKVILPEAAINAGFHASRAVTSEGVKRCATAILDVHALVDGYGCDDDSAEARLLEVVNKKKAAIELRIANANAVLNGFTGQAGSKLFLSGKTANQIKRSLIESGAGYNGALSVCLCVCGPVGSLNIFKGFF